MGDSNSFVSVVPFAIACATLAAPDITFAQDDGDDVAEEIIVTGSRIKRRDLTAPSPITTLEKDDFAAASQPMLEETLNQMPQFVPNMSRSMNNGSNGQAQLDLRGLGPQRTLVLLNGRRQAPSGVDSAVDVNNIPQVLIDRVEIITGGASTVYGSDALSGVVNFITRNYFQGFTADLSYGVTQEGDGEYRDLTLAYGTDFADGRGNVVLYGGYFERDELYARERELTQFVWQENQETGVLETGGSSATPATRLFFPDIDYGNGPESSTFNPDGTPRRFADPDDRYNYQEVNYIQTPLTRKNVGLMGSLQVGNDFELYLESAFTNNDASIELAPAPLFEFVFVNTDNPVLTPETRQIFEDNALIAPGLAGIFIGHRLTGMGPRHINTDRDYWRTVLGIRGEIGGGWEIDGWVTYTKADEAELLYNTGSLSRFMQALLVDPVTGQCFDLSDGCVPLDIFGEGRISDEAAAFLRYEPLLNVTSREQKLASVYITGTPFEMWAGPLDMAFGLEWRSDEVNFKSDDALFTGDAIGYNGDAPVDGIESVTEIYAEAIIPLLSGATGAEYLGLEIGGRYSDYDNAGGVWTYKAGGAWQINQSVRLRAMWQESVRAPNNLELFQENFGGVGFYATDATDDDCSASQDPVGNGNVDRCIIQGLPADQVGVFEATLFYPTEFVGGGNPNLIPETANTVTFGATLTPEFLPNWSFSVDYYEMEVENEIGGVFVEDVCWDRANVDNVFCDSIIRDATGNVRRVENLVQNRGFLSTSGVDTQIMYGKDLPDGLSIFDGAQISIKFVWTHMLDAEVQQNVATSVIPCQGYFGSPRPCGGASGTAAVDRIATNIGYYSGPLGVMLTSRWISGTDNFGKVEDLYFDTDPAVLAIPSIGSQHYLNLNISYEFSDSITARFGVANLLGKDAPMMADNTFANNTDSLLFDIYGRSFSLSVGFRMGN